MKSGYRSHNRTTFDSNFTGSNGGAILYVGNVQIGRTDTAENIFLNNSAGGRGGAVEIRRPGIFTFTRNSYQGNSSVVNGGAITARASRSNGPPDEVIIIGDTFTGNETEGNGGALIFDNGVEVTLCKVEVEKNEAGTAGGGLYAATGAVVDIAESKFDENKPDDFDDDGSTTLTFEVVPKN